jgi:hypothetical protein
MARKPNYNFEKRRKEQARKARQEEKRTRKRDDSVRPEDGQAPSTPSATHDPPPVLPAE